MIVLKRLYNNKVLFTSILVILALLLSLQNLVFYLQPNTSIFVFLAIVPFIFSVNKLTKSYRFGWLSLLFIILYFFFKLQLLFFLSFSSFVLFTIESNHGKVNSLVIFIILLISPYSQFIFGVFGFPARLMLTDFSAILLSNFYENVESSGNNIILGKNIFSVDPECMGLKMVGYGYAVTLLIIHSFEKKHKSKLSLKKIIGILVLSTLLIVTLNLFRIVAVVIVEAQPNTVLHEIIGLLSFLIYLVVPIFFIVNWVVKSNKNKLTQSSSTRKNTKLNLILSFTLLISLAYFNINRTNYRSNVTDNKSNNLSIDKHSKSLVNGNVVKFENDNSLIYIKPACAFYAPDHSPTICWRGSGYAFKNIVVKEINGHQIYHAELIKKQDKLYTAWWFDNGVQKTISQMDWRWRTLKNEEPFRLINVTSSSAGNLNKQIDQVLTMDFFSDN